MAKVYVKLGKKASSFRDQAMNITILPGQVVALDLKQQSSRKIRAALNGGHLVYAEGPQGNQGNASKAKTPQEFFDALQSMVEAGESEDKILKSFTLDQFKQMAELVGIEVEKDDTKRSIYEVLVGEINPEGEEE